MLRSLCLALALLLAALPARADSWYESYDKAEEAIARERWSEAVLHLNAALQQTPNSSASVRTYGMRFIQYFPYLKLGIAYFHLGQAEAALQAFETEERQGAVARSADALALLQDYRERIQRRQTEEEARRQRRAESLLGENLAAARELEAQGEVEDALAALARVLAVAPDHPEARGAQQRLLAAAAAARRRREGEERRAALVEEGRQELAVGRHREAAASFSEALELGRDAAVEALLAEAQQGLRRELQAREDEAERQRLASASLRRAAELEAEGELAAALRELQVALALDPGSSRARALERRLIQAQASAEQSGRAEEEIRRLLGEAEGHLAAGDPEQALRTANRVLALEPANEEALRQITRGYARLSDTLLAADGAPPTILLDDGRPEGAEGDWVAAARSPRHLLTGTVYDSTPVEISFLAGGQAVGEAEQQARAFQGVWITDFRWQHRLPPGRSVFEVVAVDGEGNRATLPYTVEYRVPFLRSWWFPAAIAGGLAALLGAFFAAKARRRRKLLEARFNPYIAGAPILEHERFFGRRDLLDYVLRRIPNNSIMLYGERRIGKTSFQHQLKRCLTTLEDPDHEFYPVYVDLQGTPQERFFSTLAAEVFHELGPKLNGLEPEVVVSDASYGYRELVIDLQRVLRALKSRTAKRVKLVLLIDEVDELNDYDPRINQRLRSLFMRAFADSLVSVVSGVAIKKHWEREGSPWYNFFQEIEVKPLDPQEARALIEAPVQGVFRFEEGAADEIIRRTDSKPYLIQRLCSGLVDRMHEQGRQRITAADVEAACRIAGL